MVHNTWTILLKDMKQEARSKAAVNSIFLFAIVTLTAVSFSMGNFSIETNIHAALLWIIILFTSMSGFSHVFLKEEEARTADTLKLMASPNEIFLGKLLFNMILLMLVVVIIVPLYLGVFNFEVKNFFVFFVTLFLGTLGLSMGGTIVAAIIAKASSRGALFSILAFPILLPVLIMSISATRLSFTKTDIDILLPEIQLLFIYSVIVLTASMLLFEYIWND